MELPAHQILPATWCTDYADAYLKVPLAPLPGLTLPDSMDTFGYLPVHLYVISKLDYFKVCLETEVGTQDRTRPRIFDLTDLGWDSDVWCDIMRTVYRACAIGESGPLSLAIANPIVRDISKYTTEAAGFYRAMDRVNALAFATSGETRAIAEFLGANFQNAMFCLSHDPGSAVDQKLWRSSENWKYGIPLLVDIVLASGLFESSRWSELMRVEGSAAWYELLHPPERVLGWILLFAMSMKDPIEHSSGSICDLWALLCQLPKPRADMFEAVGFAMPCPHHTALARDFQGAYGNQYKDLENQRRALCYREPHSTYHASQKPSNTERIHPTDIYKWLGVSDSRGPMWEEKRRSQLRQVPAMADWVISCESFYWNWKQ